MSAAAENYTDFVRQKVQSLVDDPHLFENEAPMYSALMKNTRKYPITQKGYRLPYWDELPGGGTAYLPSASSFNDYVPTSGKSMYVFPTYLAMPMIFQRATINMLKSGSEDKVQDFGNAINQHVTYLRKWMEFLMPGDGSGALAFSSSTVSTLGTGQTVNLTTTAAATFGQTKGGLRLRKNHFYQAINTTTGAVRGLFKVETKGTSSVVVNLLQGSISSGDPLVEVNSYNRVPRGFAHLISKANRILQTLNTANDRDLNSPEVDLAGALCTVNDFDAAKVMLQTRANQDTAGNGLLCFLTPGFYGSLRRQGYNLTIQSTTETVGVAKKFADGDTVFIQSADMDDDRAYFLKPEAMPMFEESALGTLSLDGNEWRMLFGDNGTGSDDYQRAIGIAFNAGMVLPRSCAYIKRAKIDHTQTQVNSF